MQELRSQEGDINYLYRQLQKLSRVIKEGSALVAEKDSITNVDQYLAKCKVSGWGGANTTSSLVTGKVIGVSCAWLERVVYYIQCV